MFGTDASILFLRNFNWPVRFSSIRLTFLFRSGKGMVDLTSPSSIYLCDLVAATRLSIDASPAERT